MHRIFSTAVSDVYPHYVRKVVAKGRTVEELQSVMCWLTGFDEATLQNHLSEETTFSEFFDSAHINSNAVLITGTICGVKIQEIQDPLMLKIRYLDKLVDELAKGRPLEKILRTSV